MKLMLVQYTCRWAAVTDGGCKAAEGKSQVEVGGTPPPVPYRCNGVSEEGVHSQLMMHVSSLAYKS